MQIQIAALVIGLWVLPWIGALTVAVLSFIYWRFKLGAPGPAKPVSIQKWLGGGPPIDRALRGFWVEGRAALRAAGETVAPTRAPDAFDGLPRSVDEIHPLVNVRVAEIKARAKPNVAHAVFAALMVALSLYGIQALVSKIQLAPLERVDLVGEPAQAGYIFEAGPGPAIFVPQSMNAAIYLTDENVQSREICAPVQSIWSARLLSLSSSTELIGADCSTKNLVKK